MITLEFVYVLMGLMVAGIAIVNLRDRTSPKRYNNAAFWGLYAISFLVGSHLPFLAGFVGGHDEGAFAGAGQDSYFAHGDSSSSGSG